MTIINPHRVQLRDANEINIGRRLLVADVPRVGEFIHLTGRDEKEPTSYLVRRVDRHWMLNAPDPQDRCLIILYVEKT